MRAPRRKERGQAALLGIVGVVILAIGMYTSYNLSRSVYEKIQLQNAADSAAYTLATLEARTFNFIAFANRAQIANYVQMMEAQSLLSSATFTEGYAGIGGDVTQALGKLLNQSWLEAIGVSLERLSDAVHTEVRTMETFVPQYIATKTAENFILFLHSAMLALATASQLAVSAEDIVRANDPDARLTVLSTLLMTANLASFVTAFDFASAAPRGSSSEAMQARRVMAELANAARYGSTEAFRPAFVVDRAPFENLATVATSLSGNLGRRAGMFGDVIGKITSFVLAPGYIGTTKILTEDGGNLAVPEDTASSENDRSLLAVGDAILAKDILPRWENSARVVSGTKGEHCRYEKPDRYGSRDALRIHDRIAGEDWKCDESHGDEHVWRSAFGAEGGIQPYLTFAPKLRGLSVDRMSFNQPDVWIALSKSPEAMGLPGGRDLDFEIRNRQQSASLDARPGEDGLLGLDFAKGFHAIARAQVYYHRPGAWHEPPNLFNPFWGARLAPKGAALDAAFGSFGLPESVTSFISDNIWMH